MGTRLDYIARTDFLSRAALPLRPAAARCHDQRLSQGMRIPRRPRARLERHARADHLCRSVRFEQRIDALSANISPVNVPGVVNEQRKANRSKIIIRKSSTKIHGIKSSVFALPISVTAKSPSVTRKEKDGPPGEISLLGFCTIRTATPSFTSNRTNSGNTSRQATARNSNSER